MKTILIKAALNFFTVACGALGVSLMHVNVTAAVVSAAAALGFAAAEKVVSSMGTDAKISAAARPSAPPGAQ